MCSVCVDGLMDGLHGGYTHCAAGVRVFTGGSRTDVSVLHGCVFVCVGETVAMVDGTCVSVCVSGVCLASHVPPACCVAWRVGWGVHMSPGTPLFSFGQGLTYTNFTVSCTNVTSDTGVDISCGVTNTGPRAGDDVLLVFHSVGDDIKNGVDHPVPQRRLVDFGRVTVGLSSTETVGFSVTAGE